MLKMNDPKNVYRGCWIISHSSKDTMEALMCGLIDKPRARYHSTFIRAQLGRMFNFI
ncbi:hypothetical protein QG37_03847 [Candidozyma auris]|nr:hypothetical protein QG37_03847 [[Candida] auris]